jgi:dihydrofolate reductase
MRKLKVQVQMSTDGFMASEQGDVAWATLPWDPELTSYITDITRSVDTILLGRRLAEGFIPAWAARPGAEDPQAVEFMNQTPRLVLSTSLETSPWPNASIVGGLDEVADLLNSDGGDVIAYGGGTLVSGLIRRRLVDELYLMINPVAIGAGMPVFGPCGTEQLELLEGLSFTCGITVLTYRCR